MNGYPWANRRESNPGRGGLASRTTTALAPAGCQGSDQAVRKGKTRLSLPSALAGPPLSRCHVSPQSFHEKRIFLDFLFFGAPRQTKPSTDNLIVVFSRCFGFNGEAVESPSGSGRFLRGERFEKNEPPFI